MDVNGGNLDLTSPKLYILTFLIILILDQFEYMITQ